MSFLPGGSLPAFRSPLVCSCFCGHGKYFAWGHIPFSPFSIVTLAKFYGVSTDYLLGMTETKNHPDTELDALHLSDDAIEVLKVGKFNHRLLSEMLCHKDFQRMMLTLRYTLTGSQICGSTI
jgi:hypothetical protein